MPGIIKITRDFTHNLAGLIGNMCACFFDSVLAWLWLSALLLVVAAYMFSASIKTVGNGSLGLSGIVAIIAGMLLIAAGGGWVRYKFGEERAIKVGGLLSRLILPAVIIALALWLWSVWDVPDIWDRPVGSLTFDDILQNVLKLAALAVIVSFISALVKSLVAYWKKA